MDKSVFLQILGPYNDSKILYIFSEMTLLLLLLVLMLMENNQ